MAEALEHDGRESVWWHSRWIPIAAKFGGDYIVMDLAPTESGNYGQILH